VKKAIIWSDGGLKTKESLFFFQGLARERKMKIEINFYAPHGHNVEDGHFGQGKQEARKLAGGNPMTKEIIFEGMRKARGIVFELEVKKLGTKVKEVKNWIRRWF